jgi:HEAT repeat protein
MTSILLASVLALLPPSRARGAPPAGQPAPAAPRTLSDDEVRDRVEGYLGTIDTRTSTEDWRALGTRGAAILEQVAQDPRTLPTRRAKAVAGLSAIGATTSGDVLVSLARSEQAPLTVRLAAVDGAPFVIPADRLAAALKPVLENAQDGVVRGAAAEVLSRHGECSLVLAQARRGDDKIRMQRALERCGQR